MLAAGGRGTSWVLSGLMALGASVSVADPVRTEAGLIEGVVEGDGQVRAFKGIPFAAPPVGNLRWAPPQPVASWEGVRSTQAFGPRCMQGRIFDDMVFRDEPSEDCLYLNVWAPTQAPSGKLPVMVWIHGGGFAAGSASEPRQDGGRLSQKGVAVVGINYRLGVFGFLSHAELTKESSHHASGNYGLMDQVAALQWVQRNIAAFGGDPDNVTIFGESAGSFAVSALMVSPLARGLFHRAIGESGAFFTAGDGTLAPKTLSASEEIGAGFAVAAGEPTLAGLRAKPAEAILEAALKSRIWFSPNIDGHVLSRDAHAVFAAGEQARVPLLAGWNADEIRAGIVLAKQKPTAASFAAETRKRFGTFADAVLKVYPATSDAEALESAAALASDLFIGYATWKWVEMHLSTGDAPVFRYSFDRKIPVAPDTRVNGLPATAKDVGARHAGEIEYVFGALDSLPTVPWQPSDRALSDLMMSYWSNFARAGDPNGAGLPAWPRYGEVGSFQVMHLDETSGAKPDTLKARYQVLDEISAEARK
jgi:para-nitrobenzyl esterase